jgi:glycosyltransferase involved in cell wall biosynthesis
MAPDPTAAETPARPLVSIALCTYNGERYLAEQLDSLLAQDHPSFEIVAVDDGSTDGTLAILSRYAARDARLRWSRNPENLGFRRNFAEAMRRCRGALVAPCDQDDVWRPDKLRLLAAALGGAAAVYADSELVDDALAPLDRTLAGKFAMGPIADPAAFVFSNCVSGHAMLVRREVVERALPLPEGLFHDWWLAFVAAGSGGIAFCPERLVKYRQHGRSVTDIAGRRSVPRSQRPPGHALPRHEAIGARLHAFAAHEVGRATPLVLELDRLWRAWWGQWLAPRLALTAFRHRHRLFAFLRDERGRRARNALQLLPAFRLKAWFDPRAYRAAGPPAAGR